MGDWEQWDTATYSKRLNQLHCLQVHQIRNHNQNSITTVTLPPVLDMSIHAHLEISVGAPGSVRRCRKTAPLAVDLAKARLVARPSEGTEDTNLVLEVRPSKARFAEVALLVQHLEVLLHLHDLRLFCFDMVGEVAVAHNLRGDHPIPDSFDFLTDNLEVGGGADEELEEPTGERENGAVEVVIGLCIQISDVGDCLRSVVLEETGATPIWELLDPVGRLPETFFDRDEETRGLVCVEDVILLRGNARGTGCILLDTAELSFQPSDMLVAGRIIGRNFSLPLLDIGKEPQGNLPEGTWGHSQLKEVIRRCGGDGRLGSWLAINQDDGRGVNFKDGGCVRHAFRGAHSGAPIQGCGRHLVRVVKGAEGILVLAEEGVFQAVGLREVETEEVEEVSMGLLGHKDKPRLEGVSFPKGDG